MAMQRKRRRRSGGNNNNQNNNPNRHFESNGPDVRIRGSAQQILDKYLQYARDAQTSGDRIKAEGLFQHAEHYARIVATFEKQKEDERREREEKDARRAEEQASRQPTDGDEGERPEHDTADPDVDTNDNPEDGPRRRGRRSRPVAADIGPDGDVTETSEGSAPAAEPTDDKPRRRRRPYAAKPDATNEDEGVLKTLSRGVTSQEDLTDADSQS